MINNIDEFIDNCLFFQPSPELTIAIVGRNQMALSEPLHSSWDEEEVDLEADEDIDDFRASESVDLTEQARSVIPHEDTQEPEYPRIIGERLYHFLASLSESPHARNGGVFPLWEVIPGGMATALGLPRGSSLLKSLTEEFRAWLRGEWQGRYKGPWWQVVLDDNDNLVLNEIASKQDNRRGLAQAQPAFATAAQEI
jgi:hypothetical protein